MNGVLNVKPYCFGHEKEQILKMKFAYEKWNNEALENTKKDEILGNFHFGIIKSFRSSGT